MNWKKIASLHHELHALNDRKLAILQEFATGDPTADEATALNEELAKIKARIPMAKIELEKAHS